MNKTVMTIFIVIRDQFSRWIASVADFILTLLSRFAPSRTIRLVENENGELVPQSDQESSNSNLICDRIRIIDGQIDHAKLATLEPALSGSQIELVLQSNRFHIQAARTSQSRRRIYGWHRAIPDRSADAMERRRCCIRMEQPNRS